MSTKVTFDPTISLGHILTAGTMLSAALAAYYALDKRIAILEEARTFQLQKEAVQESRVTEKFSTLREDLAEIKKALRPSH